MTARSSSPLGVGSGDTLSMQDPGQCKTQSRSSSQAGLLAPGSVLWLLYSPDVLNSEAVERYGLSLPVQGHIQQDAGSHQPSEKWDFRIGETESSGSRGVGM